jgi:transposase InsO family protein
VRFQFIEAEKAWFPVTQLCRLLQVSRSGYYAWRQRKPCRRAQEDQRLLPQIRAAYQRGRGEYGSPRVHRELVEGKEPVQVGRHRVARLMRQDGLVGRKKRRFVTTTQSDHQLAVAPNLLQRNFEVEQPNKVWVGDITYVRTWQGWLYLAVLLDLFSRRVVGWASSSRIDAALTLNALQMALSRRGAVPGLIHHSDRGSQYASADYQKALTDAGMVCSMSRKGDCWDNAVAESFFATLEWELLSQRVFPTRGHARSALFDYIEVFYNPERRHSYLGYASPIDFERMMKVLLPVAA